MKKVLFVMALALTLVASAQRGDLGIGINAGIPLGNLADTHSVAFGADVNYQFYQIDGGILDKMQLGATLGYVHFIGKDVNGVTADSRSYIPLAGSVRFNNGNDSFFIGSDLGYAFGITPSGDRGGVYYKPFLGYNISENFQLILAYTGIKKKQPTFGYANLGIAFKL